MYRDRQLTNFLGRVDGRVEVFQQASLLGDLVVDEDFESLVWAVQRSALDQCCFSGFADGDLALEWMRGLT